MQMLHYHMGWECLDQPSTKAGKRTRPLLTLLCTAAAGGDWQLALPFAAGVELIHNFSLVHDDIQDGSPQRRGRATVWKIWGEAQAINAGDALFTYAHLALQRAVGLPCQTHLTALEILDRACIALTLGQHLDLAFETCAAVTVEQYMEMIEGKTAALIATAAELGVLAAGAPKEVRAQYRAFGHHLGLAFQIRDDVLGIWGDAAVTGKPAASDIEMRKKTLPVVYGLAHSPALRQAYQAPETGGADVPTIVELLEACGARSYTEAQEHRHAFLALQHLGDANPQGEAGDALRELALNLLGRTS
jgi:geranylgeranyl diphosphate synthase type I